MTKRGTFSKRGCFLGLALLLAGLTGAVPVFAASTESPIPPAEESVQSVPPGAEPVPGIKLPTDQQMAETLDGIAEKEADEQKALEAPAAVKEREASRLAYAGVSPAEAEALLTEKFPQVLEALNSDPARYLSDAQLDRPLGETAAEVTSEGKTSVMEGPVPVQAENDEGELSKVDLALEQTSEGWSPANPLVEVAIGSSVEEGVEVGSEGLVISQDGAEESTARPFGDKNLYFSEVEGQGSDTDMLVAPTAAGAEIFDMLRSANSPQTVRFHVELPEGAQLRPAAGGGAEILAADGSTTAEVPAPRAVDAQGRVLPVSLEVEGDTLVLGVQHREAEVAYPILLDPEVIDNWAWSWWNNEKTGVLSSWFTVHSAEYPTWLHYGTTESMWPGHQGLALAGEPASMPPEQWLQYGFAVPNSTVYFEKATILPFKRSNRSCSTSEYPQPHDYEGMWYQGHWNESAENLPQFNQAETGEAHLAWGQTLFIGMGSGAKTSSNTCWRDLLAGGVEIWLNDWNYPSISEVTGVPTGWLKKSTAAPTVNVTASDEGLGVKEARVFGIGSGDWVTGVGCQGTFESPCPSSTTKPVTFKTEGFPYDGEQKFSIQAKDPTGKAYTVERTLKLDGGAPTIALSGQFAEATAGAGVEELSLPVYNLKITAEDGTTAEPRSGVKEIKVYVGGELLGSETASCSPSPCPQKLEWTYPVPLTGLTEGKHTLEVRASDSVGNESQPESHKIEFTYIPATGMKEDYVLQHFVLPDGKSYEGEPDYEGPELAVNVTNGNVVFHQRDVEVHGPGGHSLELERIYNSQQPPNRDGQWGRGWSLAQTPEFKPESGSAPKTAQMVRTSAITSAVQLPETESQTTFSSRLHATIGKTSGGGYEVRSATEEETSLFNSSGRIEETKLSSVSPEATAEPEPVFPVFAESFGSEGTGNGQFNHPADAVVDSSGNVWVVDKANNRLEEFNEAGEFVRAAGSLGSGAGQLSSPSGIARDAFGNLDVTDTANNRVVRFNEKGEFISAIGTNVNKTKVETSGSTSLERGICTAASGNVCQAGTAGFLPGRISEPIGITTNGFSYFLVVEKAQNRVEKFSPNGELVASFGSTGSEAGQLKEPTAITSSPAGTGSYWVADTGNNRVEQWSLTFSFIRQVGKEGSGNAEFKRPAAIEADSEGNVYVGDVGNDRVQELSRSGDYVTQFGGEGQLSLSSPMGIVLDGAGDLWVTDSERNQVQEWLTGSFLFSGSRLGSFGTGSGQFSHPADVAPDGKGNLWVLDRGNSRIEKFSEKGEFLTAAGSQGTGAGKLSSPAGLAIDPGGNLWVADTADNRVEEFNEKGEFVLTFGREVNKTKVEANGTYAEKFLCTAASGNVCQAGVANSGEGGMNAPQGIAATADGNVWVADTGNNRLKKFSPTGALLNNISSEGSEAGKVKEPAAIAVAPDGSIWVADTGNNRIEQWNSSLAFVKAVGKEGTGNGQFKRPAALDVDSSGNVWVGDQNNQRLQELTGAGAYVAQLGSPGQFAFSSPMGLATDGKGNVWVTDTDHNRVQKFPAAQFTEPVVSQVPAIDYTYSSGNLTKMELKEPGTSTDPALNVGLSSGLATSVASETAGTTTYGYASGNLTSKKNAEGETKFTYNANNQVTKVELPNGTWAQIEYDSIGRATKVILKPAGKPEKTTHFWYGIEPRETRVWGDEHPEVIYSINKEGAVFKWQYAEASPIIEELSGSLWENRNKELPNKDQTLSVNAFSAHEIASIKVIQNGHTIIGEETCEDKSEPPAHNCDKVNLVWVMNPSEFTPGQLNLEIVATDFLGHSTAEPFWVTIPQQPPADPEAPEPPDFQSTKQFREDYGLDRTNPLTQPQLNKLVLELLYEWEAQIPAAVTSVEEWGVPMRAPELAEMNYRREYIDRDSEVIPQWAEEHAPSTYAGFYVDDHAGGVIYVGFTENQAATVEALKGDSRLINPAQIHPFPSAPTTSLKGLEELAPSVSAALAGHSEMSKVTSSIHAGPEGDVIHVGATDVIGVTAFLHERFGSSAPITVEFEPRPFNAASRYASTGPIIGGSALVGLGQSECTAGFGARAPVGETAAGKTEYKYFALTAGHCYPINEKVYRQTSKGGFGILIGEVRRNTYKDVWHPTDAGAVLIVEDKRSHRVLGKHEGNLEAQPVRGIQAPHDGENVCWSGVYSGVRCGEVVFHDEIPDYNEYYKIVYQVLGLTIKGDSGGPVWDKITHRAVGLISAGTEGHTGRCWKTPYGHLACNRMDFTPLLPSGGANGIVPELGVEVLTQEE